jgi:TP901 family phage tail tape measure protein
MSLKIDRIQLDIVINTNPARLELAKLDEKAAQLRKELRKLPEGSAEFIAKSKQLKEVVAAHDQIIQKLGVTGLTMKELGRRATELKAILRNLDPNSAQFKELDTQLKAVNARFAQLRGVNVQTGMSLSKLAEQTNRYIGLITMAAASITGMVLGVRKAIDAYAEWDDKLSDVMKTTGLSKTAVKELDAELKKINTRTSQMELLDLARVAGKLGITGKEDIAGFVRAANQIKVALTEDLGGNVEESINQLGKLSTIFKIDEKYGTEAALLKIGSAINSLGAASTANEGYLVEFSKRVAGVAPQAGISIEKVLGLAATLDQLGQTSEVSSTVFAAVIPDMFKDTAKYANIAGMGVKDFGDLLAKDSNEAFIKFLSGLKGNNGGLAEMATKLDGLGLEGKRSISVLGVLAANTDILRQQQALANSEFEKGTSITNEYNTKNVSAQAQREKAIKSFQDMAILLGEKLMPMFTFTTNGVTLFMKALVPIITVIDKLTGSNENLVSSFNDQLVKVSSLQSNILPLANRYDELKAKTELSKTEQDEMQKIIKKITEVLPGATDKFDEYGNAISISTSRVRDFVNAESARLKVMNKDAIKQTENDLKTIAFQIKAIEAQKEQVEKAGTFRVAYQVMLGDRATTQYRAATQEEIAEMQNKYQILLQQRLGYQTELENLNGDYIKKQQQQTDKEKKLAEELELKKIEYRKKTSDELKKIDDDVAKMILAERDVIVPANNQKATAYEELNKKISETEKLLRSQIALGSPLAEQTAKELNQLKLKKEQYDAIYESITKFNEANSAFPKPDYETQYKEDTSPLILAQSSEAGVKQGSNKFGSKKKKLEKAYVGGDIKTKEDFNMQLLGLEVEYQQSIIDAKKQAGEDTWALELELFEKKKALNDQEVGYKKQAEDAKLQIAGQALGALASLFGEQSTEYKILASAMAVIDTYKAATGAYAAMASIPFVGPGLGIAAAATAILAGLANVAKINAVQFAEGRYPVTGAQDGHTYQAGYQNGARTGFYNRPTLIGGLGLVGERGREIVISNPHVRHLQMNYPEVIRTIMATRVPQYAGGNYPAGGGRSGASGASPAGNKKEDMMIALMAGMLDELKKPTRAYMTYNDVRDTFDDVSSIENSIK